MAGVPVDASVAAILRRHGRTCPCRNDYTPLDLQQHRHRPVEPHVEMACQFAERGRFHQDDVAPLVERGGRAAGYFPTSEMTSLRMTTVVIFYTV